MPKGKEKLVPPGSEEAVEAGCTCPIFDNNHGAGIPGPGGRRCYYFTNGCPVHTLSRVIDIWEGRAEIRPARKKATDPARKWYRRKPRSGKP